MGLTVHFVLQLIYGNYDPDCTRPLAVYIEFFGVIMLVLAQLPSFHSLRYINLASLVFCLGFALCVVGGCIYAGMQISVFYHYVQESNLGLW